LFAKLLTGRQTNNHDYMSLTEVITDHFSGPGRAFGRLCVCVCQVNELGPRYLACWFNLT